MKALLGLTLFSIATGAAAQSLCSGEERTYFSCKIRGSPKVVSICGSVARDAKLERISETSWLQYRFGRPEKVELVYPIDKDGSILKFEGEYHHPYQGFVYALNFRVGSTEYSVSHVEGEGKPFYGVSVLQKKTATQIPCESKPLVPVSATEYDFFTIATELAE